MISIPFNRPSTEGRELELVRQAIANWHISGDGTFTRQAHEMLSAILNGADVLLTTSCTHALEMAAILLDIQAGDEVIVPTFTFVSTVNAFVARGARPVFADIRTDTLNLDERHLERLITSRTRAIVPVHYAGVACEMDIIMQVAGSRSIEVVEDNAHGLFGRYYGRPLGTFGRLAAQSFHETKNVSCGEGGALVINDASLLERAEVIREKGTNRSRFFRGLADKYTWVDVGSSYLPSDMLAAYLVAQLECAAGIQAKRAAIWRRYAEELRSWAERVGAQLPFVPDYCEQPFHMFYLIFRTPEDRKSVIAHLLEQGIQAVFHYVPLNVSPMGVRYGGRVGDCPVGESVSDRLLRLPFYNSLSEPDQGRIIECIRSWRGSAAVASHV